MQIGRIQDCWIKLSQNEWVSQIEFLSDSQREDNKVSAVNLREDNKVSESNDGRIQDGCHHQVESEWMSEVFLCTNGGN